MHSSPLLSIVIPTHKRAEILRTCLKHIEQQTIADQLEVIVVSDGHDADTATLAQKMTNDKSLRKFQFLEVPKSQQGIARNRGVHEATAPRILFIGDDIFLAPDACKKHLETRNPQPATPTCVLGFTTWDPACHITPVMRWLESSGWQFGYPTIQPFSHSTIPPSLQHRFTYTSHISLPTEIAKKFPFREDVTLYGWEDIEWGWRLKEAGVKLFYEPDAKALHHHHMTMKDSLKRMETLGKSAVVMDKMVPELMLVPRGWKRFKYQIASLIPVMRGAHVRAFLMGAPCRQSPPA